MEKILIEELVKYSEILESYYNDMVDFEFVLENKKIYILSARLGKRTPLANLKIVMSMFCEGRLSVEDVVEKLPYQQLQYTLLQYPLSQTEYKNVFPFVSVFCKNA